MSRTPHQMRAIYRPYIDMARQNGGAVEVSVADLLALLDAATPGLQIRMARHEGRSELLAAIVAQFGACSVSEEILKIHANLPPLVRGK